MMVLNESSRELNALLGAQPIPTPRRSSPWTIWEASPSICRFLLPENRQPQANSQIRMPKEMCPSKVPDGDQRGWIIPIGGAEKRRTTRASCAASSNCAAATGRHRGDPHRQPAADTGARYERIFGELGASRVTAIDFDTRRDCEEPNRLQRIEQATGLFFTGGNQLRITTVIGGTPWRASFAARTRAACRWPAPAPAPRS
jgi:hypothetical protein